MTASALIVTPPLTQLPAPSSLQEVQSYAKLFAESGMFPDVKQMAQAAVRILAGSELGIRPFAAINGLHVIKGKVTLSAGLMATLIKRSNRYNYRLTDNSDERCEITFYEMGEVCGISVFTTDDAKKAELLENPMYKKFRRNMLFSRAMSNGARWYCADVFGGPVYTHEEMGANVNSEGEVITLPFEPAQTATQTATQETSAAVVTTTAKPSNVSTPEYQLRVAALTRWKEGETSETWMRSHLVDILGRPVLHIGKTFQIMTDDELQWVVEYMDKAEEPTPAAPEPPLTMTAVDEEAARHTMEALTQ